MPLATPVQIAAALLLLASLASPAAGAPAQSGPFTPGLRWTLPAQLSEPWIPLSVAFAGRDQLVWAAGAGAAPRLLVAPSPGTGAQTALYVDATIAGAVGSLKVVGAAGEQGLFALSQHPAPDAWNRRTLVTRHDVLDAARGQGFRAAWSVDLGLVANGPGLLGADAAGERVVAAAFDGNTQSVTVAWIAGRSGALQGVSTLPGESLRALAVSADGRRTALIAGSTLHIWSDPSSAAEVLALASSSPALALSADGRLAAVGGLGSAQVFAQTPSGSYLPRAPILGAAGMIAARVGLSADGSTLGLAWWDVTGAGTTRLEVRDADQGGLILERVYPGQAGGLQNAPQAVHLTADGGRAAFATWGDGGVSPQVLLLERSSGAALLEVHLPGSALDLALDAGGTRLAVVAKNVHANQLGSTGEVRLYDTGERDLELLEPPRHGGRLRLATRIPGASWAFFLLGSPSAAPQAFPGVVGELAVDRGRRLGIHPRPADGSGRADLDLALPADPALIGSGLRAQAALRVGGGLHLTQHAVDLLVL